ncbi:MAG: DsbA family protein [Gammaproteobacteria bacterium]|nr:DsbA family protein [Gammaproteobacteria bacterium]
MTHRAEIKITVFSDYICPFCYVGHHRLMRLQDHYDLKINWCFLEIHPENSAAGEPVTDLDYSTEFWNELMQNLKRIAFEEAIPLAEHTFTTNSRDASLLAEAAKQRGRETFYRLHEKLFSSFFVEGKNIGDRDVLRKIGRECDIDDAFINAAWTDPVHPQRLLANFEQARRHQIKSVPSFVFGDRVLTGVVEEAVMREAAACLIKTDSD